MLREMCKENQKLRNDFQKITRKMKSNKEREIKKIMFTPEVKVFSSVYNTVVLWEL